MSSLRVPVPDGATPEQVDAVFAAAAAAIFDGFEREFGPLITDLPDDDRGE